jgi:hypothetical protein
VYSLRFREAAHQAYEPTDRNAIVHKLLLDVYIRGLRNTALVDKLVMESNPATLDEAFVIVAEFIAREERKKDYEPTNREEPMEVGAVTAGAPTEQPWPQEVSATSTSKMEDAMCNMARQMQGIQKEITRLKASSISQIAINSAATASQGSNHQHSPVAQINQTTRGNNGRQPK